MTLTDASNCWIIKSEMVLVGSEYRFRTWFSAQTVGVLQYMAQILHFN
jgi:uncharacterized membrane protein YhhN